MMLLFPFSPLQIKGDVQCDALFHKKVISGSWCMFFFYLLFTKLLHLHVCVCADV